MFFSYILSCLYFFAPALIGNMMASVIKKISFFDFLEIPVDFEKKINKEIIFGNSKTWRGLIMGNLFGTGIVLLQWFLYDYTFFREISLINYREINILLFAFLMCFGALVGDLVFSFFKRRKKVPPGKPWIPFDQLDFVLGSFLFLTPYLNFTLRLEITVLHWIVIVIISFLLHVISNNIGYYAGIQENRW